MNKGKSEQSNFELCGKRYTTNNDSHDENESSATTTAERE